MMKLSGSAVLLVATVVVSYACGSNSAPQNRQSNRRATVEKLVGYISTNDVSDQAAIDRDQKEMESLVLKRKINEAKQIYQHGGHSMPFARVTLLNPKSSGDYPAGSQASGINDQQQSITGKIMKAVKWDSNAENVTVDILYDTDSEHTPICQVGALTLDSKASLQNCFTHESEIRLGLPDAEEIDFKIFNYTYSPHLDNLNGRTLQTMALEAATIFRGISDFETFVRFYGQADYADRWAMAAVGSASTNFKSGMGNADFSFFEGRFGKGEGFIKGSAFLNIYMYVIGKLELAVRNCKNNNVTLASLALDEAVAYYAGSLADDSPDGSLGVFMYGLANSRALSFKTAGHLGDKDIGTAFVNVNILSLLKSMQIEINSGNVTLCQAAADHSREISNLMKVPLIQSVLAYAYVRDQQVDVLQEEIEKADAKAATYAAALLPYVDQCSPREAAVLYENSRVGSLDDQIDFAKLKQALERTYNCLGVTCYEVGGIWDGEQYVEDASPCGIASSSARNSETEKSRSVGSIFGVTIAVCLLTFFVVRYRNKLAWRRKRKSTDYSMSTIAAVSEIS